MKGLSINYIVGTYPEFSTTFIDREIRMMRQRGLDIVLLSIRQPVLLQALSQEQRLYQQDVTYLIPVRWIPFIIGHLSFLLTSFRTYVETFFYLFHCPHPTHRDRLMTLFHFAEGVYAAYLLKERGITHLYAHFVDRAATVALVVGRLLRLPYSLAIHAGPDIYVHPVLLPEKIIEAQSIISCTRYNLDYLKQQGIPGLDNKAIVIHHGIDFKRYKSASQPTDPPLILAVGQLTEKKGFEYLIRACRRLKGEQHEFTCHIIGPGPQRQKLEALIEQLMLQDIVQLRGALPHDQVVEEYQRATMFVLPCIRSREGDLDGIPNALAEAMAAQVPVISTFVSAIPELIENEVNGLLVPPYDDHALAAAIARLLDDPPLRQWLGKRGQQTVIKQFDAELNTQAIYEVFVSQGACACVNP